MANSCRFRLPPYFAGLDALVPRVTKLDIASTSAVSEPRPAVTAATTCPRFRDGAAFGAYGTNSHHPKRWALVKTQRLKHESSHRLVWTRTYLPEDVRWQASAPFNQLWPTFLSLTPPQLLYQSPPGAQQLALPDFSNVPHCRHANPLLAVLAILLVLTDVVIGTPTISCRSGTG